MKKVKHGTTNKILMIDDEVLHKKYGTGIILKKDIDKAEVDFEKFGLKKVYLKFLQIKN